MQQSDIQKWAEELSDAEAQLMLLKAAKEHPIKFTDYQLVAMSWAKTLRHQGYNALNSYARGYLASRYVVYFEEPTHRGVIPLSAFRFGTA